MIHRSLAKQRSDFILLSKVVHPVKGLIERKKARTKLARLSPAGATRMQQVARVLLEIGGSMTYFKLTKLIYLIDLACLEKFGHTVASPIYLRQVDGPWPPDLDKALEAMKGYEVRRFFSRQIPMVGPGPSPRFKILLEDDILEIISDIFQTYGSMSNAEIKTAVYRTRPMRFILGEEKKGKKMINKPVIYKDKTAKQLIEGAYEN